MQIIVTPVCTKHIPYSYSTPALLAVTLENQSILSHHHVFNGRNPKQKDPDVYIK